MAGVVRPMTLVDVFGTLNQQIGQLQQGAQMINGLGTFAEADEVFNATDAVTATAQVNPTWGNSQWGVGVWG